MAFLRAIAHGTNANGLSAEPSDDGIADTFGLVGAAGGLKLLNHAGDRRRPSSIRKPTPW
jgi:hypothetical protein